MSLYIDIEKQLENFNLRVKINNKKGWVGLLGQSGCGKSVTLKCIAGLEKPDKGKIIINNKVVFDSDKEINISVKDRNIGFLFQNYALFPHMTVKENIEIGIKDTNKNKKSEILKVYINKFDLKGLEDRYPFQLSGGQSQRVAIARALATNPEILLLDEPFSALDYHLRKRMEVELLEILKEYNGQVVFVTHDIEEAYRICDNSIIYNNGIADNLRNTKELFMNPQSISEAKMVGFKNISTINILKDGYILADDWGYSYKELNKVYEKFKYISVRERNINIIKSNYNKLNEYKVENIIENIYTYTIYLKTCSTNKSIQIEMDKEKVDVSVGDKVGIEIDTKYISYF